MIQTQVINSFNGVDTLWLIFLIDSGNPSTQEMDLPSFDDGICDDELNIAWYNFDNGDCCENNTASRLACDVCLCNVTIMETLRRQNGFNCSDKLDTEKRYNLFKYSTPSDGICNPSMIFISN